MRYWRDDFTGLDNAGIFIARYCMRRARLCIHWRVEEIIGKCLTFLGITAIVFLRVAFRFDMPWEVDGDK